MAGEEVEGGFGGDSFIIRGFVMSCNVSVGQCELIRY